LNDTLLARALRRFGYELRRTAGGTCPSPAPASDQRTDEPWSPAPDSMLGALARFAPRFEIATVIDIGASDGRWSLYARRYFESAEYFLIEAQGAPHEPALRDFCATWPRTSYLIAAAGPRVGSIHFDTTDALSGSACETPFGENDAVVPLTTVDHEVDTRGLQGPFLLKLDTHGFEREILAGAALTLPRTSLIVIEAYNFEIRVGCMRFHQLCEHLEQRGFRCVDVVDVLRRPGDGVLWQFDLFFAPADRPEFAQTGFA
jgi:FkbM family methyltransferase